jgi:hypothetical protein
MERKILQRIGKFAGLTAIVSSVNAAEMRSLPENPIGVVGSHQRVFVYADNSGLNNEPTDGAEWVLYSPPSFQYIDNSSQAPITNDFFEGMPMFWEVFSDPGIQSARLIDDFGGGPVGTNGFVGEYSFIASTTPGIYTFPLTGTKLVPPSGPEQPHSVFADPITIVRDEQADFDKNGSVDNADYSHFQGCMTGPAATKTYDLTTNGCVDADFDFDGDVDQRDYQHFQEQFTGEGNPVQ